MNTSLSKKIFSSYAWIFILCASIGPLAGCNANKGEGEILKPGGEEWSFIVVGDPRSGYDIYAMLIDWIVKIRPTPVFAILSGDLITNQGNLSEWREFLHCSKPLADRMLFYTVVGNHDVNSVETESIYKDQVRMPGNETYYSFAHGNYYFIVLDTEVPGEINSISNRQMAWLEGELIANSPGRRFFIFMHRPLFPQGGHLGEDLDNADQLQELFKTFTGTIVFAAHEHQFLKQYKDGVWYIISGGGGAPLHHKNGGDYHHFTKVSIYPARINIKTAGIHGEIIADFDI